MSHTNVERLLEEVSRLDDGQGPAALIDAERAHALVQGALERSGLAPTRRSGIRPSAKILMLRRSALWGVGFVIATTAAAALTTDAASKWIAHWTAPETVAPRPVDKGRSERARGQTRADAPSNDRHGPVDPSTSADDESRPTAALGPHARPPRAANASPPAPRHTLPPARASAELATAAPGGEAPSTTPSRLAGDLLARANQLRRQRRYRQALTAYLDVVKRYPGTRQADAAQVAAAALRLEHLSDAEGAVEQYRAAAANQAELGEEAAYGLAEAHRAANRPDLERRQLQQFLQQYPTSPWAARARQRLHELGDRGL